MKRTLAILIISALATASQAQTATQVVNQALLARNAPICEGFGLALTCTDAEAQAAWCAKNNKPEGAQCVASDVRSDTEKVFTAAQLFTERQDAQAAFLVIRAAKQRKQTLQAVEFAIVDPTVRAAVCAAASIAPADCK